MDRFQAMRVFVRIVEANSLRRAAETLGLPSSSVSTILRALEAELGVQLLQRTTRRLSLTADGEVYLDHARRVLDDMTLVEAGFLGAKHSPAGRLKVDVAMSIGRELIIPRLSEFRAAYPQVTLLLNLSDRTADVVEEGLACAIRTGTPEDSATLIARPLGAFRWQTCASPKYLRRYGEPADLDELKGHECLAYSSSRTGRSMDWEFLQGSQLVRHSPNGHLFFNDADSYAAAGAEGLGLIQAGTFLLEPYLRSGALEPVLKQYTSRPVPVSMVYARHRELSPVVRAFHNWVQKLFSMSPLFEPPSRD